MELALYWPGGGYYTRPATTTGPAGDFSTSPDVSPAFGRRIALQVAEIAERLGDGPWRLVEIGPGRGLLASDLLEGLAATPQVRGRLAELILVERNPALMEMQRSRLAQAHPGAAVRWIADVQELEQAPFEGVVIANEILDALPVHVVVRRGESLLEQHVGAGDATTGNPDAALSFIDGPVASAELVQRIERYRLCSRDGYIGEVSLATEQLLASLARGLARGAAIFIDYGHPAERLADEAHSGGTVLGYAQHQVVYDYLTTPGQIDLTAHVNWTHFDDAARAAGFEIAGRITQDKFLLALGIVEDMVATGGVPDRHALAARRLVLSGDGGGKRFEVAILTRGVAGPWRGLDLNSSPSSAKPQSSTIQSIPPRSRARGSAQ